MIKIHGKNYMEVKDRVRELHNDYHSVDIITNIISDTDESVVFRAEIVVRDEDMNEQRFTGTAQEYKNSTQINTTSCYENCETSAVGRACAFANIGNVESIASADEVANAVTQGNDKASTKQCNYLMTLANQKNYNQEIDYENITKAEAGNLITLLLAKKDPSELVIDVETREEA